MENLGDGPGATIAIWDRRHGHYEQPDEEVVVAEAGNCGHGGADPRVIDEFLEFVAHGGRTDTSPVAARQSVAAGVVATESLRSDGSARQVPPLPQSLIDYFERGQTV